MSREKVEHLISVSLFIKHIGVRFHNLMDSEWKVGSLINDGSMLYFQKKVFKHLRALPKSRVI